MSRSAKVSYKRLKPTKIIAHIKTTTEFGNLGEKGIRVKKKRFIIYEN